MPCACAACPSPRRSDDDDVRHAAMRVAENRCLIAWVRLETGLRSRRYRYALEHLLDRGAGGRRPWRPSAALAALDGRRPCSIRWCRRKPRPAAACCRRRIGAVADPCAEADRREELTDRLAGVSRRPCSSPGLSTVQETAWTAALAAARWLGRAAITRTTTKPSAVRGDDADVAADLVLVVVGERLVVLCPGEHHEVEGAAHRRLVGHRVEGAPRPVHRQRQHQRPVRAETRIGPSARS